MPIHPILIKRIYTPVEPGDGYRVLVDRLWPRGMAKTRTCLDEWNKNIAPTSSLRQWFGHQPERFPKFTQDYTAELDQNAEAHAIVIKCRDLLKKSPVTLLYSAKDEVYNHAIVLQYWLKEQLKSESAGKD